MDDEVDESNLEHSQRCQQRNTMLADIIINPDDFDGCLHYAALRGDVDAVNTIIMYETEPQHRMLLLNRMIKPFGSSPIRLAATGGHVHVIRKLLELGAELDTPDLKGQTPLFVAVSNGHLDCVKYLLECGANPNGSVLNSTTPLCLAVQYGMWKCVLLLLRHGAETEIYERITNKNLPTELRGGSVSDVIISRRLQVMINEEFFTTLLNTNITFYHTPLFKSLSNDLPNCYAALLVAGAIVDLRLMTPPLPEVVIQQLSLGHAIIQKSKSKYFAELFVLFGGYLWQRNTHGQLATEQQHRDDQLPCREVFTHYMNNPLQLRNISRIYIRQYLGRKNLSRIYFLPLPETLIDFLCYKNEIPAKLMTRY